MADDRSTLVAVAHGSRAPAALRTVTALLDRVRAQRPGLRVELGHVELNAPLLPATLGTLPYGGRVVLVPLLLARGHHVKHDLPAAAAEATHLATAVAAPLGPHPLLAEALADRLREAGWRPGPRRAVVLAAAGSRDPDASHDTAHTAGLLSHRLGGTPVVPAAAPAVEDAVTGLRADGYRHLALASCFTAPGLFAARCAAAAHRAGGAGCVAAAPLGAHPALARLVLRRYDEAVRVRETSGQEASVRAARTPVPRAAPHPHPLAA